MTRISRTRSRARVFLLTLVCSGVLVMVSLIAYGVAGAHAPPARGNANSPVGNPNFPFPTDAKLDPTLAVGIHRQATARATAATGVARDPQLVNRNLPPMSVPRSPGSETGIFPQPLPFDYGSLYSMDAVIENYYRTFDTPMRPNWLLVVIAGASRTDAQAGIVGVGIYEKNGLKPLNSSLTPTKHGSVHIVSVHNNVAVLQAQDGTQFSFDFVQYAFV